MAASAPASQLLADRYRHLLPYLSLTLPPSPSPFICQCSTYPYLPAYQTTHLSTIYPALLLALHAALKAPFFSTYCSAESSANIPAHSPPLLAAIYAALETA